MIIIIIGSGSLVSPRLELRRDILQLLCIEPLPHSVIVKRIPSIKGMSSYIDLSFYPYFDLDLNFVLGLNS